MEPRAIFIQTDAQFLFAGCEVIPDVVDAGYLRKHSLKLRGDGLQLIEMLSLHLDFHRFSCRRPAGDVGELDALKTSDRLAASAQIGQYLKNASIPGFWLC